MERIFYNNQYIKDFTAEIETTKEIDNKYHITLDKTAFFPGGGGQYCDLGTIDNINVIDVYEENNEIYHILEKKPNRIHKVKCFIDWDRREYGMQHHFGQHVISACFNNEYRAKTTGFHLGKDFATVDIEGYFTEEDILKVEDICNKIIRKDISVESFIINKKQAKKLKIKDDLSKIDKEIRVVKIGDLDINLCCGIHSKSTLDLRMIKFKKFEKYKKGTRIEFVCGTKAIEEILKRDIYLNKICKYLSSNEEDSIKSIENLNNKSNKLKKENNRLQDIICKYEVKDMIEDSIKIEELSIVVKTFEEKTMNYINKVGNKLVEEDNIVALLALRDENKINILFTCSKNIKNLDMNILLKDSIKLIDGRGGGSKVQAQGGGKDNGNIDSLLNYVVMKIKEKR